MKAKESVKVSWACSRCNSTFVLKRHAEDCCVCVEDRCKKLVYRDFRCEKHYLERELHVVTIEIERRQAIADNYKKRLKELKK